ncbi:MAG: hypothetical protein QOJ59_1820, partial [Thermomicrobiales bacterium]|nr:hypothetical protein [Thermomicrobiales bacterium]
LCENTTRLHLNERSHPCYSADPLRGGSVSQRAGPPNPSTLNCIGGVSAGEERIRKARKVYSKPRRIVQTFTTKTGESHCGGWQACARPGYRGRRPVAVATSWRPRTDWLALESGRDSLAAGPARPPPRARRLRCDCRGQIVILSGDAIINGMGNALARRRAHRSVGSVSIGHGQGQRRNRASSNESERGFAQKPPLGGDFMGRTGLCLQSRLGPLPSAAPCRE